MSNRDRGRGPCSGFSVSPRRGCGKSSAILAGQQAQQARRGVAHLLDGVPTLTTSLPYVFERSVSALPQSNVDRSVNRRKRNRLTLGAPAEGSPLPCAFGDAGQHNNGEGKVPLEKGSRDIAWVGEWRWRTVQCPI